MTPLQAGEKPALASLEVFGELRAKEDGERLGARTREIKEDF